MDAQETAALFAVFALALLCLYLSVRSFLEKGFLMNNAWIWASAKEKESMNKRPYYRQSGFVFLLLTGTFAAVGIFLLTKEPCWQTISLGFSAGALVYAILSACRIRRTKH